MQTYLGNEFYKNAKKSFERYSDSYDMILERAKALEQLEQELVTKEEQSYEVLEHFGAIV